MKTPSWWVCQSVPAIDLSTRGTVQTDVQLCSLWEDHHRYWQPFAMYELYGEVRWVKEDAGEHAMGVLFEEREGTDYLKWEADFKQLFPDT